MYHRELCNKNCIIETSEMLITCSTSCYTAGSDNSVAIEDMPERLLKKAVMMFRVHSRHIKFLLTYGSSESAMIVNFQ